MAKRNQINPTGTPEEQVEKIRKAVFEIDAKATATKLDINQFKAYAQEKRAAGFGEQAQNFEASADKLECKHLAYVDVLRIIKTHLEDE